jgi:hypothetical protein
LLRRCRLLLRRYRLLLRRCRLLLRRCLPHRWTRHHRAWRHCPLRLPSPPFRQIRQWRDERNSRC